MKKIVLMFLTLFFVISCNQENSSDESISKQIWDIDNIAYSDTSVKNNEYKRVSGSHGIIGKFICEESYSVSVGTSTRTITYEFNDNGYYSYKYITSTNIKNKDSGTFRIKKSNIDNYYCIEFQSNEGHGINTDFYQVNDLYFNLEPYLYINDGIERPVFD